MGIKKHTDIHVAGIPAVSLTDQRFVQIVRSETLRLQLNGMRAASLTLHKIVSVLPLRRSMNSTLSHEVN